MFLANKYCYASELATYFQRLCDKAHLCPRLQIEPTESEGLAEIDRFCDAMITIRREVDDIASGKQPKDNNMLKNAPHPISVLALSDDQWQRPYTREQAVYPDQRLRRSKFWPAVGRVDEVYGERNVRVSVSQNNTIPC